MLKDTETSADMKIFPKETNQLKAWRWWLLSPC